MADDVRVGSQTAEETLHRSPGSAERLKASRWFDWLLRRHLWLLVTGTFVPGVLLILLRTRTSNQDTQSLLLSSGVALTTFAVTTVLLTVFGSQLLERKLLNQVGDDMNQHMTSVMTAMQKEASDFRATLATFVPLFGNTRDLGLDNVYLTRADALRDFGKHITSELKEAAEAEPTVLRNGARHQTGRTGAGEDPPNGAAQPGVRLWIVGSSMKGILETAFDGFDGNGLLTWAADLAAKDLLDLRILLTHPKFADYRAKQENRNKGAIPAEIGEAQTFLQRRAVPDHCVRAAEATPTVFAIATRERMLLNPYPLGAEAFRSFTLTIRKVHDAQNHHAAMHRDIFEQYEFRHFERPWASALPFSAGGMPAPSLPTAEGPAEPE